MAGSPPLPPRLLALTPGTLQVGGTGTADRALDQLVRAAAAALEGGVRGLLVREPLLEDGAVLQLALRLRGLLDGVDGGWLGVHDRLHLAAAARADGVHVGGRSLPVPLARRVVGALTTLGVSTHEADDDAVWQGADYALHGPVFSPRSKAEGSAPIGVPGLRAFVERCGLPVLAVGGIDAARAIELAGSAAGLRGVALIGGLWGTGPEPLDGRTSSLVDHAAITERARALTAASGTAAP